MENADSDDSEENSRNRNAKRIKKKPQAWTVSLIRGMMVCAFFCTDEPECCPEKAGEAVCMRPLNLARELPLSWFRF